MVRSDWLLLQLLCVSQISNDCLCFSLCQFFVFCLLVLHLLGFLQLQLMQLSMRDQEMVMWAVEECAYVVSEGEVRSALDEMAAREAELECAYVEGCFGKGCFHYPSEPGASSVRAWEAYRARWLLQILCKQTKRI